jgi:hypothetical protein
MEGRGVQTGHGQHRAVESTQSRRWDSLLRYDCALRVSRTWPKLLQRRLPGVVFRREAGLGHVLDGVLLTKRLVAGGVRPVRPGLQIERCMDQGTLHTGILLLGRGRMYMTILRPSVAARVSTPRNLVPTYVPFFTVVGIICLVVFGKASRHGS